MSIVSRPATDGYRRGWDATFGKKLMKGKPLTSLDAVRIAKKVWANPIKGKAGTLAILSYAK